MIMKGKWKTRAMAFVMAFTMGMSSMIPSSVYAAAEQPETKVETETQVFEEQTEEKVRAEDIVKDVSDKEFRVETSMEGISYDPERESVLLSEIKDQDGGSFQPEKPAVYYAQYLVTPKDGSEPYMIGRTITLTDTEGLAHSESNGGEKQKEDTSSEEDSEQPLPVEITSSQPEDTPDVLAELERDIEEGNVMMFSAADGMGKSETVHLNKGRTIYYPDYLGNYLTCLFTVNGKLAYCLESHRASPPTGDYVADILESNKNLQKVLYYGYGGAGDITGSYLSGKSDDEKYVYTHLAASYAYCGALAFTGCPYENLVNAGVIAYINHLFGMEEPPKGELSFSNANVTAVREGDIQKTPDIALNGDHRNKITIPVPQGVTGYNKSKGTNVSGGNLEVYGGDTFYLQAPLTVTGKWESGQLYGSVRESWKTLVLTSTGGNNQDIGAFISEKAAPVSFGIQWLNLARVKILKKDAETGNPLDGAVYGVYKNSACTDQLLTIAMTGEDGISYSDYFDAALETVYVKEITAPNGYAINKTVYPVHVSAGSSVEVEAVDTPVKGKITVKKQDVDTGDFLPQGDAKLDGAVYGLYAKEDIQKPDGTGVLYKAGSLIQEKTFGKSGEIVFENVYLGAMYVKEIAAPEGYLLDETEYDATLIYEGQEKPIVVKTLTVKEKVKKQAFQIIKISEDGDQTETDLVEGAEFTIYLVSNLSKVKDGTLKPGNGSEFTPEDFIGYDFTDEEVAVTYEDGKEIEVPVLVTDKKGYAKSVELPYGQYVVAETKTPENLKQVHPFLVTVNEDSREPQEWRVFDDRPFEFMLKIIKKDAETGNTIPYAGAGFQIYDPNGELVTMTFTYPEVTTIDTFYTTAEGELITPQTLEYGKGYSLVEVQAPYGYVLDSEPVYFDVEQENSEEESGVTIVRVERSNMAQKGKVTVTKSGEVFSTVAGDKGLYQPIFSVSGLEGAVYEIAAAEDIVTLDGTVRAKKGEVVDTVTTGKDGTAKSKELYLGRYEVKETTAPYGMVLNDETHSVELEYAGQEIEVTETATGFYNERQRVEIDLVKSLETDEAYGIGKNGEIFDVTFGLYAETDLTAADGTVIPADGLIEIISLDENGKGTVNSDLPFGSYYVKELSTNSAYVLNEQKYPVHFEYAGQDTAIVHLSANDGEAIENEIIYGSVSGLKSDEDGNALGGAVIGIFKTGTEEFTKENAIQTTTSADDGSFSFAKVPYGTWVIREIESPTGFVLSEEEIAVTVGKVDEVVEIELVNYFIKGNIELTKVDADYPDNKLTGAVFEVYADTNGNGEFDKDDKLCGEMTELEGGVYQMTELRYGKYFVREKTAPDGFVLDDGVYGVSIEENGKTYTVENKAGVGFINDAQKGSLKIVKTSSDGKVEGFSFRVTSADGYDQTFKTDKNGEIFIEGLRIGEYTVSEVSDSASAGYILPADKQATVKTDSTTIVEMHNEFRDTPKTGDDFNLGLWVSLAAASVIGAGVLGFVGFKKKKKED